MVATTFVMFAGLREHSSANITNEHLASGAIRQAKSPVPSSARRKHDPRGVLALRLTALFALILIPFWNIFGAIVSAIGDGSQVAYLIVVPVLVTMIAVGYRTPPRGVGDAESDWILAAIFGGLGLFLRYLMSNRFPTLSGLWQLPLVGAVLWAACAAAVLFGVRRVMQMWSLWVFALGTLTPLPYLLVTAAAGGGVVAAAAVAGAIGGLAVLLAGREHPLLWRLCAGVATTTLSVGAALIAVGGGDRRDRRIRFWSSSCCAQACSRSAASWCCSEYRRAQTESAGILAAPRRSTLSLAVLGAGAAVVLDTEPALRHLRRPTGSCAVELGSVPGLACDRNGFRSSRDTWGSGRRSSGMPFPRYRDFPRQRWTSSRPTTSQRCGPIETPSGTRRRYRRTTAVSISEIRGHRG